MGKFQAPPVVTARIGIYLLGLLLLVSFIIGLVEGESRIISDPADPSTAGLKPLGGMFVFGGLLIISAPQAFFLYMAQRRRLWALILAIAVNVVQIALYFYALSQHGITSAPDYLTLAYWVTAIIAVASLLTPRSLRWFKGGNSDE